MSGSINNSIVGDPGPTPNSRASVPNTGDPVNLTLHSLINKTKGNLTQVTSGNKGGYRKRKLSRRRKNKKRNTRRRR